MTWSIHFLSQPNSKFFCDIDKESFEELSNHFLNDIPYGQLAKNRILNVNEKSEIATEIREEVIDSAAEMLYGLVHKQYITTEKGLSQMKEKYDKKEFGCCERVYCHSTPLIPIGLSNIPGTDSIKLFCSTCMDVYRPPLLFDTVDACFFGTLFASAFYAKYESDLNIKTTIEESDSSSDSFTASTGSDFSMKSTQVYKNQHQYIPKIFGFRINENADHGPKNAWLRAKKNVDIRTGYEIQ